MTPAQLARLAALRKRSRLARLLWVQGGGDWRSCWEAAGERLAPTIEEQPGNEKCSVAALTFWRDRFGLDTYCDPCYRTHLHEGVIESGTFEPYSGPADFCDCCLQGFSG